jgi:hypothetical protein
MLSIISSGNRGCCSSTVPKREPHLMQSKFHLIQLVRQPKLTFEAVKPKQKELNSNFSNFDNGTLTTGDVMVTQLWPD